MKTAERAALDFALAHIERHGDTQASAKATQYRLLLAQEHEPEADATGDPGKTEHRQTNPFPPEAE